MLMFARLLTIISTEAKGSANSRGGNMPRVGENVKVKCQYKHCGRNTWVKWGYPSNCEHCGHPVITP
jgi:hypothetical protein